jgi:integrase
MKGQRRKRAKGCGAIFQRDRTWWIRPPGGRKESSGSTVKADAERLLDRRMGEARVGRLMPEIGRAAYDDLERMLIDDMRANGRRSVGNVEKSILPPLRAFFGGMRAREIGHAEVSAYIARRLGAGAARATVRYERWALRRMFVLAVIAKKMDAVPMFPAVNVGDNARKGFCSPEEIERVISFLPEHAQAIVRCLYWTGWRCGEVLGLTWARVDFEAGTIRLDAADSKTNQPRVFPFAELPALADLLRERREATNALARERGRICPNVFHLEGEPIGSFRTAWRTAVKKACLPWLTPHDMRRSAARNLVRAGVPEKVVMDLCGWKSRSMLDRYHIVSGADLRDGVGRLGEFLGGRKALKSAEGTA